MTIVKSRLQPDLLLFSALTLVFNSVMRFLFLLRFIIIIIIIIIIIVIVIVIVIYCYCSLHVARIVPSQTIS
jgi:hypothetical protein